MSCTIKFNGEEYSQEEFATLPVDTLVKELLKNGKGVEFYVPLTMSQIRDGLQEDSVLQSEDAVVSTGSMLSMIKDHAKNIQDKIRSIFKEKLGRKKGSTEQVNMAMVLLDRLASVWAERNGVAKEMYYQRFIDVRDTDVGELVGDNSLFQSVGRKGARSLGFVNTSNGRLTAMYALRKAQILEKQGVDASDIWKQTRWERGADGMWRTEVPDLEVVDNDKLSSMIERVDPVMVGEIEFSVNPVKLKDIVSNSDILFRAYPELGEIDVYLETNDAPSAKAQGISENRSGFFTVRDGKAVMLVNIDRNPQNTIVHELQHAVQFIEGMSSGTTREGGDYTYVVSSGEVEARNAEARLSLSENVRSMIPLSMTEDVDRDEQIVGDMVQPMSWLTALSSPIVESNTVAGNRLIGDQLPDANAVVPLDVEDVIGAAGSSILHQDGLRDDPVYRAAVEFDSGMNAILHLIENPDISSLVHEFAHIFEQDLTDEELSIVEQWSGHKQGTLEFKEAFAQGFEKFMSEPNPALTAINKIFSKFADWLAKLYRGVMNSPLDIELNNNMRAVYSRMLGVSVAYESKLKGTMDAIQDLPSMEREKLLKELRKIADKKLDTYPMEFKMQPASFYANGTRVLLTNGLIKTVGVDKLDGGANRKDGVGEAMGFPSLEGVATVYDMFKDAASIKAFGLNTSIQTLNGAKVTPTCS